MIKEAYEVFTMERTNGATGYARRHVRGHAWTKGSADVIAKRYPEYCNISKIHVMEIHGRWHRVNVIPLDHILGDVDSASSSKIDEAGQIIVASTPAIILKIYGHNEIRLPLNLEKAMSLITKRIGTEDQATIKTRRMHAANPISFNGTQLPLVREWLTKELTARGRHYEEETENVPA